MNLPTTLDEALAWFGALTPGHWELARIGAITVAAGLLIVAIVVLLIALVARGRRRG